MSSVERFDVIVVGGGHAGVEACWAAAKLGCKTALLTMDVAAVARMSCNPAIGGTAKGQMVREIDALGGLMGLAADEAGIQFRMLHRSQGPAVWAPRAQADRKDYHQAVLSRLRELENLKILTETAEQILLDASSHQIVGIGCASGRQYRCQALILTPGTFLRGLIHLGSQQWPAGRIDEPPAEKLSQSLERIGLRLSRLKTGTPPRLDTATIDFDSLEAQPGDEPPVPFSFISQGITRPQVQCWITWTNFRTHEIIRSSLDRAPLYTGQIRAVGPRYCPSIETKIMRFAEKVRHQVFLEPEGLDSNWIYCNGLATSLPPDIQEQMVHSVVGLERARIVRYGYAIEYDFVPPKQLQPSLEVKSISGLFLAGQINGTSGYEEAAAQGLLAGINAARRIAGLESISLTRDQAYIGVMIDDLVTKGTDEPYRMFTSRAEFRLCLRSDNADGRLTPLGRKIGLVDDRRWEIFSAKQKRIKQLTEILSSCRHETGSCLDLLRRPDFRLEELRQILPGLAKADFSAEVFDAVRIAARYAGYIERQGRQVERFRNLEDKRIPANFDYSSIAHLRAEARERLLAVGPASLGQAARIPGINPADIAVLMIQQKVSGHRPSDRQRGAP
ncbi:MAG: tRNA uridine-5-carboxymethylaminomethyl(34) synthesis enzyme MnmG [Phycisphaerae bacterium]|nr:tRNA uridine-5-carboxymethylaminomethyl(34) synthesis enzyme MnmG [Phycisphaerae bacterium]